MPLYRGASVSASLSPIDMHISACYTQPNLFTVGGDYASIYSAVYAR